MAYRIVELTKPTECHVNNHQLIVEQEDGTVQIPVEDIEIILCIGAKIRFSTMGLGELNQAGIVIVAFGKKHEPETIIEPYFPIYHKGLNRRNEDPVNSALNYGYAIVRSFIIKSIITTGFHCALGINHHNEYNNFNLADDLIEPWRAMVDQLAYGIIGDDFNLSMKQRRELTGILHKPCKIDGKVMKISTGIELMVDSFKTAVVENQPELIKLPILLDFKTEVACES